MKISGTVKADATVDGEQSAETPSARHRTVGTRQPSIYVLCMYEQKSPPPLVVQVEENLFGIYLER